MIVRQADRFIRLHQFQAVIARPAMSDHCDIDSGTDLQDVISLSTIKIDTAHPGELLRPQHLSILQVTHEIFASDFLHPEMFIVP